MSTRGFWKNWCPPQTGQISETSHSYFKDAVEKPMQVMYESSRATSEAYKFGAWIPPAGFRDPSLKRRHLVTKKEPKQFQDLKKYQNESDEVSKKKEGFSRTRKGINFAPWKKEISIDWGERILLHDVTKHSEGDLIWGIVDLGIFTTIKLWVNDYNNVCCSAGGEISKLGCSEVTFISVTNTQLLQRMLNVSLSQWAVLCETVQETKATLKFDAFQDCELTKKTTLERMWFFICKRRHFLPRQCMLLKFCGAVKCMRKFSVTPKLLVQDIRDML